MSGSQGKEPLLVTLIFHKMPASLLVEFTKKIAKPYYDGNLNEAFKNLMECALIEEEIFQAHVDKRQRCHLGVDSKKRSGGEVSV